MSCHESPICDINAECRFDSTSERYICICNEGYQGDGTTCYSMKGMTLNFILDFCFSGLYIVQKEGRGALVCGERICLVIKDIPNFYNRTKVRVKLLCLKND